MRRRYIAALALIFVACLDDPMGPGTLMLTLDGGSADTVWSGAPGEALPPIRIRIRDEAGHAIPGASVTWETSGERSGVASVVAETNASGEASAVWTLGRNAAEEQRLHVIVQTRHHGSELDVRARAVPYVVSQLQAPIDTPTVVRLGDSLAVTVNAIDPYGNVFPATDVTAWVTDTAIGAVAGKIFIGGPHRGRASVVVASHGVAAAFPVVVTQYVAAIVPTRDTLVFSSLGAQLPVSYVVRDDRGREVRDTAAALSVTDTSVVGLTGTQLQSRTRGAATLQLGLAPASTSVPVVVDQRIASLRLARDTIRFDALLDTMRLHPVAHDSLGFYVIRPAVVFQIQDQQVAELSDPRLLRAVTPGVTTVTVRDPATGISATVPVVVRQIVTTIDVAPIGFDALGDTLAPAVTPRDRLGHAVVDGVLEYTVGDSSVAQVGTGGQLHSAKPGRTTLTIRDQGSGVTATTDVIVQQRIASLALDIDTVAFDALHDGVTLSAVARDRLGAPVADAPGRMTYSTTDSLVAAVAANGVMQSAGNGSAIVIARSNDGPADTVRVTVAQRVAGLAVDRDSVVFQSLHAEQSISASALDRLGFPVTTANVTYAVADTSIARVEETGVVHSLSNGLTRIAATASGVTVALGVRVAQRAVRIAVPSDTVRFDALGDSATITGTALDSLGSPVAGELAGLHVTDATIANQLGSTTIRARSNGTTEATFTVAGVTGNAIVQVRQIARSMTATLNTDRPIVTLGVGSPLPAECHGYDANGFPVPESPVLTSTLRGTVIGGTCDGVRVARSGIDTLVFSSGSAQSRVPVTVAAAPEVLDALGMPVDADSLRAPAGPWAPSVVQGPAGELQLLYAGFSAFPDSSGQTRADLHRLVWLGGNTFRYDGVALTHDDNICSPQGQGIENAVILPRADASGWRMLYAAGSNICYGWQVFSAVSDDGRTWTKESGVRLSNGGVDPSLPSPWPAGEGMVVDRLPTGEWRMIVASFEHITPPEINKWQITEWRSPDQLSWTYIGTVLTTRDMPAGWQGSVYSPAIREIAPGLWRMLFTADGRGTPNSRSAIWSAVSTDRLNWQVEGEIIGAAGSNIYYSAFFGDEVLFVRSDGDGPLVLAIAHVRMP